MTLNPQMFLRAELAGVELPEEMDFAAADGAISQEDEAALLEFLREFEEDNADFAQDLILTPGRDEES